MVCVHFGNLVGLDTIFRDVEVLHILGSPEVGAETVQHAAKLLFGLTDEPLCFDRNETRYTDDNVEAVYDALVKSELVQAIGRARLVENAKTVILWTSKELPSVTHREQTTLFQESDWIDAGADITKLPEAITNRNARQAEIDEATANGDVKALAERTGQSERSARRQTQDIRKQGKADRDAEIYRRYNAGESKKGIATALNIGRATVTRALESARF